MSNFGQRRWDPSETAPEKFPEIYVEISTGKMGSTGEFARRYIFEAGRFGQPVPGEYGSPYDRSANLLSH